MKTLAGCFLACALVSAQVRITWVGQACFYLETAGGPTVVTDPPAANIGYVLPSTTAAAVTVSHNHGDHNFTAGVAGGPTVVDGRSITARATQEVAGVPFVLIPGFHDSTGGSQRGANTIIQWTQDGLRFAHFGDYGQSSLTGAQLADLRDIDVAFIPAGGFFTVDAAQAAALIAQFRPRVAVLMHFRTALGGPAQLAGFPAIAEPFGGIVHKAASVTVSRATLPASPEVWILEVSERAVTVNAGSNAAGQPVAPGSLASVYGPFTGIEQRAFETVPLPRTLGGAEVTVNASAVPLLFTSAGQINLQIPAALAPGQYAVEVRAGGQRLARGSVTVVASAPGLFALLNQDGSLNTASNPARRGQVVQIYGTGQGVVAPAVADGSVAPASPLSQTARMPSVTIGGAPAAVQFSGLAPGFIGVWQINAAIAAEAATGNSVELSVSDGVIASNRLTLSVQ